ncbi:MAG: hypothetical protein A2X02_07060 [Bacteroidetes bacterium GWF2_29_10]|nr:MAG: hypothetical protein A2X02_07060 [Bacteroidetes bacterium GWF2_29_10]HBY19565.1 hypothetical protein [Clostridiales bacterium]
MKKDVYIVRSIILILTLVCCIGVNNIEASSLKFTDVSETAWYKSNVDQLVQKGIVNGYTDGTFKPNITVTKAQFVKMIIISLGYRDIQNSNGYWANTYIKKAMQIGILSPKEINIGEYESPIIRADMAVIVTRALQESYAENIKDYKALIKDYDNIKDFYKDYILKVYSKGIIGGYEDGEFKAGNSLTRAEASVIMIRMIDASKRVAVKEIISQEDIKRLQGYPLSKNASKTGYTGRTVSFGQVKTAIGEERVDYSIKIAKEYLEYVEYGIDYEKLLEDPNEWKLHYDSTMGNGDILDEGTQYTAEEYKNKLIQKFIDNKATSEAKLVTNEDLVYVSDTGTIMVRGILTYDTGTIEKEVDIEVEVVSNGAKILVINQYMELK